MNLCTFHSMDHHTFIFAMCLEAFTFYPCFIGVKMVSLCKLPLSFWRVVYLSLHVGPLDHLSQDACYSRTFLDPTPPLLKQNLWRWGPGPCFFYSRPVNYVSPHVPPLKELPRICLSKTIDCDISVACTPSLNASAPLMGVPHWSSQCSEKQVWRL